MISSKHRNKLYNTVHTAWVTTCMAVTLTATAYLGYSLFEYFTKIRPIKQEIEEHFKEELLREGRMRREKTEQLTD